MEEIRLRVPGTALRKDIRFTQERHLYLLLLQHAAVVVVRYIHHIRRSCRSKLI